VVSSFTLPSVAFLLSITYGWLIALALVTALAWWRGAWDVRLASAACVAAWLGSLAVQTFDNLAQPQLGILAVDAVLFAALFAIALRSPRYWPMVAAGLQLLPIALHLAYTLTPHIWAQAYYAGIVLAGWLVLATLAWGLRPVRP
jgi:hypothetical protein